MSWQCRGQAESRGDLGDSAEGSHNYFAGPHSASPVDESGLPERRGLAPSHHHRCRLLVRRQVVDIQHGINEQVVPRAQDMKFVELLLGEVLGLEAARCRAALRATCGWSVHQFVSPRADPASGQTCGSTGEMRRVAARAAIEPHICHGSRSCCVS